jgi:hypothetical protein
MPIVLRLIKGSELTFAELDGNFTNLDNRLDAIEIENLAARVARLETAGTPIYYDSDDTEVIFDSIWGGTVTKYLATTDSIGLASFDSDHFNVNNGHVTIKLAGYTPSDSAGIASFDSSNFVVTDGHITINPNSAAGRVAGITIIDSTGVASFDSAQFNVSSDGHVTHDEIYLDSAVRSRLSAIDNGGAGSFTYRDSTGQFVYTGAPDASTSTKGVASFNPSDFTVSSGVVSLASTGAAFSTTFNSVGSIGFFKVKSGSAAVGSTISGSNLGYFIGDTDGSGERIGALTHAAFTAPTGGITGIAHKASTPSGSVSGTWRNMGPSHASSSGSGSFYKGPSFNMFVRVS